MDFPSAMITRKQGQHVQGARLSANLIKYPFECLALAELGVRAETPEGVFNVIVGARDGIY